MYVIHVWIWPAAGYGLTNAAFVAGSTLIEDDDNLQGNRNDPCIHLDLSLCTCTLVRTDDMTLLALGFAGHGMMLEDTLQFLGVSLQWSVEANARRGMGKCHGKIICSFNLEVYFFHLAWL